LTTILHLFAYRTSPHSRLQCNLIRGAYPLRGFFPFPISLGRSRARSRLGRLFDRLAPQHLLEVVEEEVGPRATGVRRAEDAASATLDGLVVSMRVEQVQRRFFHVACRQNRSAVTGMYQEGLNAAALWRGSVSRLMARTYVCSRRLQCQTTCGECRDPWCCTGVCGESSILDTCKVLSCVARVHSEAGRRLMSCQAKAQPGTRASGGPHADDRCFNTPTGSASFSITATTVERWSGQVHVTDNAKTGYWPRASTETPRIATEGSRRCHSPQSSAGSAPHRYQNRRRLVAL